ncbi:SAF domain-containing protein [Aeromicrobium sp. UC242_57]|uniref:SAF domain-containing protein n=1 Tax=Aeromicrobium sp. UC242_57 TaxID=3374624 RepID=UPI0037A1E5DD
MDRISQLAFTYRRWLAALFTGLAVLAALSAVRQTPDTTAVTVARHDLRSGHVITADDLRTAEQLSQHAPEHALPRDAVIGRRVAGPMRAGEVVTDFRVLRPQALGGYGDDAVLTTIRLDRADGAAAVQVGDQVDVVAVDPEGRGDAQVVARRVEVATVPSGDDRAETALGVVTTEKKALALATAGLTSRLSILTSSH